MGETQRRLLEEAAHRAGHSAATSATTPAASLAEESVGVARPRNGVEEQQIGDHTFEEQRLLLQAAAERRATENIQSTSEDHFIEEQRRALEMAADKKAGKKGPLSFMRAFQWWNGPR